MVLSFKTYVPFIALFVSLSISIRSIASDQPNLQSEATRQERNNAKKSANAGTSMAIVHGAAAVVCGASCAAIWTGGWAEVACTASTLGAGVTELVMTDDIVKAGASGAMAVIGVLGGAATTSGLKGFVPLLKMGSTAATAGKTAGKAGARNSAQKISCISTVVEAAQAVVSGMGANDAKKTEKAAQERLDQLTANSDSSSPAFSTSSGSKNDGSQNQVSNGTLTSGNGDQLNTSGSNPSNANSGDINTAQANSNNATGPCGNISTYQNAVTCAMASNPNLPQAFADPKLEEDFTKLIGTDPLSYFKDKDMAEALGASGGGTGGFNMETLTEVAKAMNLTQENALSGVGVASGGGGGGGKGSGGGDSGLASLFGNKEGDAAGGAGFERKQFGETQGARDLASLSDDPRVSLFERITFRYQIVTKRWLAAPMTLDESIAPKKL